MLPCADPAATAASLPVPALLHLGPCPELPRLAPSGPNSFQENKISVPPGQSNGDSRPRAYHDRTATASTAGRPALTDSLSAALTNNRRPDTDPRCCGLTWALQAGYKPCPSIRPAFQHTTVVDPCSNTRGRCPAPASYRPVVLRCLHRGPLPSLPLSPNSSCPHVQCGPHVQCHRRLLACFALAPYSPFAQTVGPVFQRQGL